MPLNVAFSLMALALAPGSNPCGTGPVMLGETSIYADYSGPAPVTVLLEAGNGNDSHVWDGLEPRIRANGVATLRYDRAGYGASAPRPADAYQVEQDLAVVKKLLDRCVGERPVIYVAHSYGGILALLTAKQDPRIKGIVLVDTLVPGVETVAAVTAQREDLRKQYDLVRREAPALAAALLPVVEALPETTELINRTQVSTDLPIIDIVATGGHDGDLPRIEQWREGHRRFVAEAPGNRVLVEAPDSSHQVIRDQPETILKAIAQLLHGIDTK